MPSKKTSSISSSNQGSDDNVSSKRKIEEVIDSEDMESESPPSKRKLDEKDQIFPTLPLHIPPAKLRKTLVMTVKIWRCCEIESDPVCLVTIQNAGGWGPVLSGHENPALIPTAEVKQGMVNWNQLLFDNFCRFEELTTILSISKLPTSFIPTAIGPNAAHNAPQGTVHAFGFAYEEVNSISAQKLEDLLTYLKDEIDGKPDNSTFGSKIVEIKYIHETLTRKQLPYINVWIHRAPE